MDSGLNPWSPDEYVLRAELADEGLREVLVEGVPDRAFVEDVLRRYRLDDVSVFDRTYFEVDDAAIQDAGFTPGAKGELLTIAARLAASENFARSGATVVVIVDRDYDGVPDGLTPPVIGTDYYSIENYAITERSLDIFVRRVLGREPLPDAGRRRGGVRNACSGGELLGRVVPASVSVAGVRLILRRCRPPVGMITGWADHCRVSREGLVEVDAESLARAALGRVGPVPPEALDAVAAARAEVEASPRLLIRGKDFVRLLHKVLKSPWGHRVSSVRFDNIEEVTVTTWLLGSVDPVELDEEPLFVALRDVFA